MLLSNSFLAVYLYPARHGSGLSKDAASCVKSCLQPNSYCRTHDRGYRVKSVVSLWLWPRAGILLLWLALAAAHHSAEVASPSASFCRSSVAHQNLPAGRTSILQSRERRRNAESHERFSYGVNK